jgi:hypothetical protein
MCSYDLHSFPAVVLTLGPSRWPELRNAYHILTKDQVSIMQQYSLHQLTEQAIAILSLVITIVSLLSRGVTHFCKHTITCFMHSACAITLHVCITIHHRL